MQATGRRPIGLAGCQILFLAPVRRAAENELTPPPLLVQSGGFRDVAVFAGAALGNVQQVPWESGKGSTYPRIGFQM